MPLALSSPDFDRWHDFFPDGIGPSAFSAPEWQPLMAAGEGESWRLRWLTVVGPDGPLTVPTLTRRSLTGRWIMATRPIAYYVTPIERSLENAADLEALVHAVASPRVLRFQIWLAPWSGLRPRTSWFRTGRLRVGAIDTFLIRLEEGADAHLARNTSRLRRRRLAQTRRLGLELTSAPDPAQREAYYALYRRAYADQGWIGPPFSRGFFEGVATRLGAGGELCVALDEGRVVGGCVLLYDHYAVHYFQAARDPSVEGVSVHDALCFHALQRAEERGLPWVNLGGINPGNEGLARYKCSWGARPTPVASVVWRSGPVVLLDPFRRGLRAGSGGT
jgi:hypothetical protein